MVKLKSEPVSSPDTPPMRRVIKKSHRGREQDTGSPSELDSARNTPEGKAGPSRLTAFRPVHPRLSQNISKVQRKRSHTETDGDDSADEEDADEEEEAETHDEPPEAPRRRPRNQSSLHKGNTEDYVKIVAMYSPAVTITRTTSSKRKDGTDKRTLHRFSNEEHRFIWFYRNNLGCSRGDTYVHFNEYFGLHIRKDSIANTYERLKQRLPEEICGVPHTEPWAVGENYGMRYILLGIDAAFICLFLRDGGGGLLTNERPITDENTAGPAALSATEATEDDTEEAESDIDCTDESMYSPIPMSREQKSIPHGRTKSKHRGTLQTEPARNKTQSTGPALIGDGGERSIKKPHSGTRKSRTSILPSDSSSGKQTVKRRSSYHVNEKGSPMQDPAPPSPQTRRSVKKMRKVEFNDDSESREQEFVAVKKRSKSRKHR